MFTLGDLAEKVGGEAVGDAGLEITGIRPFQEARPGDITLAARRRLLGKIEQTGASAVIAPPETPPGGKALLLAEHPKLAFARVLALFHPRRFEEAGISPKATLGRDCRIEEPSAIHDFAVVGDGSSIGARTTLHPGVSIGKGCTVGRDCTLHSNVALYPGVSLGDRVILHAGTVVGSDGFGYVFDGRSQVKMEQAGTVIIEDDVEIGANSCVDRATFGATVLERGVKLDNHVHIGHNCRIGENTVIVGCVGVSGSVTIGRNCVLAGQCGVIDHINIGDNVTVMVKTAVTKDIPSGMVVSGQPGRDHREELKAQAALRRLPRMQRELKALRRRLEELERK